MRLPLSAALRRLDRHWLLNHPVLWMMRLHWMCYFWFLGLVLVCLVALVLPVTLQSVLSLNSYFVTVFFLAGLAISPWIYLQICFAPQLRLVHQGRTAFFLLAGYLFVLGAYVAWPYAFVSILEGRISRRISEVELRADFHPAVRVALFFEDRNMAGARTPSLELPDEEPLGQEASERLLALSLKYLPANLGDLSSGGQWTVAITIESVINDILRIKGVRAFTGSFDFRDYYTKAWVISVVPIGAALLLWVFLSTDARSLTTTCIIGAAAWVVLAIYDASGFPWRREMVVGIPFLMFLGSGWIVLQAPRQRRKSGVFGVGLNTFTLLLPWTPWLLVTLADRSGLFEDIHRGNATFCVGLSIGVVMLLAFTPWLQRNYRELRANPV